LSVSGYRVVDPLDDAVVREAVIAVIAHGNDEMLVHLDADDVARLNDSCCDGLILPGRDNIPTGVIVLCEAGIYVD